MNEHVVLQWLPGILIVAAIAFPCLFFIKRNFVLRLVAACVVVVIFLFVFGLFSGHQFSFTRREDLPPLLLGLALACLLSFGGRALRASLLRRHARAVHQNAL